MEAQEIESLAALEDKHWWYRERRALLRRELKGYAPGRALDVGAAVGGNTRVLRELGWQALAVDYSPTAVAIAKQNGIEAIEADACDLPLGSSEYDLITAFDVLEHIEDDHAAAAELYRVLRPGGRALIAVPCDMALWSPHDEAVGHVRRYDRAGLEELMTKAGFVVDRLWSWNVLLRPVVSIRRRFVSGSDLSETSRLVNAALTGVIVAERYLPVRSLPGVSLMVRAHRPQGE
jgi:SAM-dependent methyltransferase